MKQELVWPEGIVAHRHEVSGNWVLWYLTDAQANACAAAMAAPDARVQLLAKALQDIMRKNTYIESEGDSVKLSRIVTLGDYAKIALSALAEAEQRSQ